jgi:drug/metabolite transporter (DMT)-like permease
MTIAPRSSTGDSGARPAPAPGALYLRLVLVALFWGGTVIAGQVLAQNMPVMVAAFGRFLVACLLLVLVAFRLEGGLPRLTAPQMLVTAASGLTGIFLYNAFFLSALARIPAGRAALVVSLNPVVVAVAAWLLFRERLGAKGWLGIVVAFAGAAVVITRGDVATAFRDIGQSVGPGETFMFLAVLSWAAYTLCSRVAARTLSPIAATTWASLWGLLFLSFGAASDLGGVDWRSWGWTVWTSFLYLGVLGTVVAFLWYYQGIRVIGPSRAAVFINLVPAFGVLLSAVLLGEPILISMIVGGLLSMLGVSMTNRAKRS